MAKLVIISPKLIVEKTLELLGKKPIPKEDDAPKNSENIILPQDQEANQSNTQTVKDVESNSPTNYAQPNEYTAEENAKKFHISLQEMKVISSALMHFQKYLTKKGETTKSQEVEAIDRKIYQFIQATEKAKKQA